MQPAENDLLHTPLDELHVTLGARMVPFAGYAMPVQYPAGLMAEHQHTRTAASLFDVSHMGQLRLVGADAATALETLMPMDVLGLAVGRQRYGLLLNDAGGIIDDLMLINRGTDIFMVVNGACKAGDMAHLQTHIGARCQVIPLPERALLALQGPLAVQALQRLCPDIEKLVFMSGGSFDITVESALESARSQQKINCFITRSGYTGEDGFEISVHETQAEALARALLAQPEVKPAGLGARNSLRLEAGLCLYGNDMDASTTPVEAALSWAIPKVRRSGGARAGGFSGAARVLAQLDELSGRVTRQPSCVTRKRVGLLALERIPVREPSELQSLTGQHIGSVTSGLLSPTLNQAIAMGYVEAEFAVVGTPVNAIVRGKQVAMVVSALPFVPTRYHR